MKRMLIELGFFLFLGCVAIVGVTSLPGCKVSVGNPASSEQTNYPSIQYSKNGWRLYIVKYEGRTYLVNPSGGIIEHKRILEK